MHIKVTQEAGVSIIHLEGDFLLEPEQFKLRERVHDLIEKGSRNFIIDLTAVKHINSCGLGSLVCAYTSVRRIAGDLKFAGAGAAVQELLNITQLVKIFEMFPTLEQALADHPAKK
jgi:anti-sigma B factor antagonist